MVDLVGTCPKTFWKEWLYEGDCAGTPDSGQEWEWTTRHSLVNSIDIGDRFYIVAHGKLRGYALVTGVWISPHGFRWGGAVYRKGGAVACTIDQPIPGFRGLRKRWWDRADEHSFLNWKEPDGTSDG